MEMKKERFKAAPPIRVSPPGLFADRLRQRHEIASGVETEGLGSSASGALPRVIDFSP